MYLKIKSLNHCASITANNNFHSVMFTYLFSLLFNKKILFTRYKDFYSFEILII